MLVGPPLRLFHKLILDVAYSRPLTVSVSVSQNHNYKNH